VGVGWSVEDYFQTGKRSMIRFTEKGGKETEIPVHHKLEELLDQYLETSGLRNQPNAPLFPIALGPASQSFPHRLKAEKDREELFGFWIAFQALELGVGEYQPH
jgi:site-specific recombinase XerC